MSAYLPFELSLSKSRSSEPFALQFSIGLAAFLILFFTAAVLVIALFIDYQNAIDRGQRQVQMQVRSMTSATDIALLSANHALFETKEWVERNERINRQDLPVLKRKMVSILLESPNIASLVFYNAEGELVFHTGYSPFLPEQSPLWLKQQIANRRPKILQPMGETIAYSQLLQDETGKLEGIVLAVVDVQDLMDSADSGSTEEQHRIILADQYDNQLMMPVDTLAKGVKDPFNLSTAGKIDLGVDSSFYAQGTHNLVTTSYVYSIIQSTQQPLRIMGAILKSDLLSAWHYRVVGAAILYLILTLFTLIFLLHWRKSALRERQAANDLYHFYQAIEQNPVSIEIADLEARILYVNPAYLRVYGQDKDKVVGHPSTILSGDEVEESVQRSIWAALDKGRSWEGEIVRVGSSGQKVWERTVVTPVLDVNGDVSSYFAVSSDMTEVKALLETLEESEYRYRTLLDALAEGILMHDADGSVLKWNQAASELFGLSPLDRGKPQLEDFVLMARDRNEVLDTDSRPDKRALRTGEPQFRQRYQLRDIATGVTKWVQVNAVPLKQAADTPPYAVVSSWQDVTASIEAEKRLFRYGIIVDASLELLAMIDRQYRYVQVNDAYAAYHGRPRSAIEGFKVSEVIERGIYEDHIKSALDRAFCGEVVRLNSWISYRGRGSRYCKVAYTPVRDNDGNIYHVVATVTDLTERRRSEEALKVSEERFRALADFAPCGVFEMSSDGKAIYITNQLNKIFELRENDSKDDVLLRYLHPLDRSRVKQSLSTALQSTNDNWYVESRFIMPSGKTKWLQISARLHAADEDTAQRYIGVVVDVTEQVKQQQLLQEKNTELERLSTTDPLTDLYNRAKLEGVLQHELYRSQRYKSDCSVIMIDVDYFKRVNDSYGHQIGDQVLQMVAEIMQNNTRNTDWPGRWGGEEFLIVCPETDLAAAMIVAENLRSLIEETEFPMVGHKTASFGVAQLKAEELEKDLLKRVDDALYQAKSSGRNKVCCSQ